jgi:hypothetical protein
MEERRCCAKEQKRDETEVDRQDAKNKTHKTCLKRFETGAKTRRYQLAPVMPPKGTRAARKPPPKAKAASSANKTDAGSRK